MSAEPLVADVTEVTSWRERAERAEERAEAAEKRAERAEQRAERAEARVEELAEQVAVLSRMLFGRSSEKGPVGSGDSPGADGAGEQTGGSGGTEGDGERPKRGQRPGSKGHGRRDYSHLDTREEIHDVPPEQRVCPDCGMAFTALGSEGSEQIDWQVRLTRIVHRRLRYRRACPCPGQRTVIAPPAPNPIPKGRFTAAFCARLLYLKFVLGLPVTRIVKMLAAEGLAVPEGTLAGVLKALAGLLEPVETAIRARSSAATHVHADETTWRVYEQTEDSTGHKWWLWVFIAEDTVVFRMDATRSNTVLDTQFGITAADRKAGALPGGRQLVMSSDFFVVYQSLARLDGVHPLWCWAHIRRYFIRAGDAHTYLAAWRDAWVARIADLYLAHKAMAAAEPGSPGHTAAVDAFEDALTVMDTVRQQQATGPALHPAAAKVLATLDREWDGLARHRDFPDLALDNNISERMLRTPVVGRKNYYGSHAEWSAHLAARVWTITATAERHGLEPLTYLTDYLNACATAAGKPLDGQALDRFLPWLPGTHRQPGPRPTNRQSLRLKPPQIPTPNPAAANGRAPDHASTGSPNSYVGTALPEPLERWFWDKPGQALATRRNGIHPGEIDQFETAASVFRSWDHAFGGGLRRKAVVGQLNEIAELIKEHSPSDPLAPRLFGVMAHLSATAATMSWDSGEGSVAQQYYLLALRASQQALDREFGSATQR